MDKRFLSDLLNAPSVSGFEDKACACYADYLQPFVDGCKHDVMNNCVTWLKSSRDDALTVMVEAHIDEIGFQVMYISDEGCIYVRRAGGIDMQCVPGTQVVVYTNGGEEIAGVIGKAPIHLLTVEERKKVPELSDLWVDTGLDAAVIKEKVLVGDVVAVRPNLLFLTENRITSKALDDKIGVFVVSQVMKRLAADNLRNANVYGVATSQEEVGCRGAVTSAFHIKPDYGITIDVDFATDMPGCSKAKNGDVKLGNGVVVSRHLDNTPSFVRSIMQVATSKDIPMQLSAHYTSTGGTNASKIQLSREGVCTLSLGIPCRYMHTPVEVCDMRDVQSAIDLICAWIESL